MHSVHFYWTRRQVRGCASPFRSCCVGFVPALWHSQAANQWPQHTHPHAQAPTDNSAAAAPVALQDRVNDSTWCSRVPVPRSNERGIKAARRCLLACALVLCLREVCDEELLVPSFVCIIYSMQANKWFFQQGRGMDWFPFHPTSLHARVGKWPNAEVSKLNIPRTSSVVVCGVCRWGIQEICPIRLPCVFHAASLLSTP